MYKLIKDQLLNTINIVFQESKNIYIPFAPDNTDYQQFKKDLADGVALNDSEGNAMTAEQITAFLGTLL